MKYKEIPFKSDLNGLSVRSPEGHTNVAYIENLSQEYDIDKLKPVFGELLNNQSIEHLVIDLSKFPKDSKRLWLLFYTGVFLANAYPREIKPKFVNIEASVLGGLKPFFKSRVAANLDEAIKSFSSYSLGN